MWGSQEEYAALKPHDAKGEVFLVLGPWNQGGWVSTTRHLGELDFRLQLWATTTGRRSRLRSLKNT